MKTGYIVDPDIIASKLLSARETMAPFPVPAMTKDQASAVKRATISAMSRRGHELKGYKVSLSRTWGALFDNQILWSGAQLERARLFDPLIETEAVFYLRDDIEANMEIDDVLARCDVGAAIEVADCRWEGWHPGDSERFVIPSAEMLEADNAFAAWLVLDETRVPATSINLPEVRVDALRDGRRIAGGTLDHVMGHPANALLWLAAALETDGRRLCRGMLVSSGNPYHDLVTLPPHERGRFDAILHGVGVASAIFV